MTSPALSDGELDALLALLSANADAPEAIAAFLRSDEPIGPLFREALAMALTSETASGSRLKFIPGAQLANENRSKAAAKKWMEIGGWIRDQIASGTCQTREAAEMAAAKEFSVSKKAAEAALVYYDEAQRWIGEQRACFARYNADRSEAHLVSAFHHHMRLKKQVLRQYAKGIEGETA